MWLLKRLLLHGHVSTAVNSKLTQNEFDAWEQGVRNASAPCSFCLPTWFSIPAFACACLLAIYVCNSHTFFLWHPDLVLASGVADLVSNQNENQYKLLRQPCSLFLPSALKNSVHF